MKLFRLPYIPTKLVLDHMTINHIFFLSLCSKNTKNSIITIQKHQFEKIERVNYIISGTFMCIEMGRLGACKAFLFFLKTPTDFINKIPECKEGDAVEEVRVKGLGTSIDFFRSPMNQTDLHAKYFDNAESLIESIHNHLCDLLGRHLEVMLMTIYRDAPFLPLLRNIRILGITNGDDSSLTRINEILATSPCLEVFSWWGTQEKGIKFEENSGVYEVDTLDVCQIPSLATDALKHFKGRHAFLTCTSIPTPDIIQFLNEWRSGEKFQNLEAIYFTSPQQVPDIRRSVEVKELNTSVEYSFTKKLRYEPRKCHFKCRSYMIRESDGHVASILLEDRMVLMGVWNMTEAEFLQNFRLSMD